MIEPPNVYLYERDELNHLTKVRDRKPDIFICVLPFHEEFRVEGMDIPIADILPGSTKEEFTVGLGFVVLRWQLLKYLTWYAKTTHFRSTPLWAEGLRQHSYESMYYREGHL